jgi:hypothetical protein
MMNRISKTTLAWMPSIVVSAVLIAISADSINNQEATAQTANATAAQTANATAANQTGASIGNITSADFSTIQDNLDMARNAIFDNDTYTAFFAMNDADSALYGIVGGTSLQQQLKPFRDQLNNAQDAVANNDLAKALQDINSAGVELVKVTQQLPSGEEGEEEEGE